MSSQDKTLISDLMGSFVSDVPAHPFVTFCVACNKGVTQEDMTYQKGKVFHKDCYDKHGSNYPPVNQELLSQNTNDIVQLVQLRNLKVRMIGKSNHNSPKPKAKTKKKSKRKTKKRSTKRRVTKRKRTATKRKKTKKKTSRRKISKNRRGVKRRTSTKKRKTTRKTKRKASRTKRKTRRRR